MATTKNTPADQPTAAPVPEPAVNLINCWTPTLKALVPLTKEPARAVPGKAASSFKALERRGLIGELNATYSITDAGRKLVHLLWPKGDADAEPAVNLNDLPKSKFDELYRLATAAKPAEKVSGVLLKRGLAEQAEGGYTASAVGDLVYAICWPDADQPKPKAAAKKAPTPRKRATQPQPKPEPAKAPAKGSAAPKPEAAE